MVIVLDRIGVVMLTAISSPHLLTSRTIIFGFCYSCSSVNDLLPAFIGGLESQDFIVIKSAVPYLSDLLLLCHGN